MRRWRQGLCGAACLVILLATEAAPAGLWFYEQSTPDQGTASAGRAALAKDASTAYGNPAGMAWLESTQLLFGAGALIIQSQFETGPGTTQSGGGAGLTSALPSLSGFYVLTLSPDWRIGVAVTPLMGLAASYGDSWAGRYIVEKEALLTLSFNPVVSYRVNDRFAVGGGMSLVGGYFYSRSAINNPDPALGDGRLELKSATVGFGGNLGVLFEPVRGTRLGATYRSPVRLSFRDVVDEVRNLGPGLDLILNILGQRVDVSPGSKVDVTLTNPQEVMFSVYQEVTPELAIMGNFGWQNWESFGRVGITANGVVPFDTNANLHFQNTYHGSVGVQYLIERDWLLMAGFAYDTSPVAEEHRTVALPLDRQFRYSAGVQYDVSKSTKVGVVYTLISMGNAPVNQSGGTLVGTVVGHYRPNLVHAIGFNWITRF